MQTLDQCHEPGHFTIAPSQALIRSAKRHVVKPFEVPKEWMRNGTADPRSIERNEAPARQVGWWAVVQDDFETDEARRLGATVSA